MTLPTCLLSFSAALLVLCWAPLPEVALSSMPVLASASIAMRIASAAASSCCPISCAPRYKQSVIYFHSCSAKRTGVIS